MRITAAGVLVILALCACKPVSKPVDDSGSPKREPAGALSVQPLDSALHGYYRHSSGVEDSARIVVRSASEWSPLWDRIVSNHGPKPALPAADFSKEVLIVVAMGTRSSGGYTIRVRDIVEEAGELVATVVSTSPGPTCGTTQALTAPMDIVRVNRVGVPVRFVEQTAVHDCG